MSIVKKYDATGAETGTVEIPDELLELEKGTQAVHEMVVSLRRRRRAGTASTLEKGMVSGTGAKPWRQKGTGRARAGYKQSPVWRGGGTVFGPLPREYGAKVNRKVARLAFRRALSERLNDDQVRVVETLELEAPRTKDAAAMLKALGVNGAVLLVTGSIERNLALAVRNLPKVELTAAQDVNVYQLLRYPTIVTTPEGLEGLKSRLAK